jgi:hypothetical protein
MAIKKVELNRRTFIRGLGGAIISLPMLDFFLDGNSFANTQPIPGFVLWNYPVGMVRSLLNPYYSLFSSQGQSNFNNQFVLTNNNLAEVHQALAPFKHLMTLPLVQQIVGDSSSNHDFSSTLFGTCTNPKKGTSNLECGGPSIDTLIGKYTDPLHLKTLNIGFTAKLKNGGQDSGNNGLLQYSLSWKNKTTPNFNLSTPQQVFDAIFSSNTNPAQTGSILNGTKNSITKIKSMVGTQDKQKLDQYFSAISDMENSLASQASNQTLVCGQPNLNLYPFTKQEIENSVNYDLWMQQMMDLMVLALQCQATRAISFMSFPDFPDQSLKTLFNGKKITHGSFAGQDLVNKGWHDASHATTSSIEKASVEAVQFIYVNYLKTFCQKLQAVSVADKTLLDNIVTVFGTTLSDSADHDNGNKGLINTGHFSTPLIQIGGGAGRLNHLGKVIYHGAFWNSQNRGKLADYYRALLKKLFGLSSVQAQELLGGTNPNYLIDEDDI